MIEHLSCSVDRDEMLRYLGYKGQELTSDLEGRIDAVVKLCEDKLLPVGCFSFFPIKSMGKVGEEPCVELEGAKVVLPGQSMQEHLEGAREVVLLAVTVGMRFEQEFQRLSATDPLASVIYDAAGSSLVEVAADALEDIIVQQAVDRGFVTNWRFSPGYGDLPLSVQPDVVGALRADVRLGITVLDSYFLLPSKSVTAVIGLFEPNKPQKGAPSPCSVCSLRATCEMRRRGVVCHGRTRT